MDGKTQLFASMEAIPVEFANVPEIVLDYREDHQDMKKILFDRIYFVHVASREFIKQRRSTMALRMAFDQFAKAFGDHIAVKIGLQRHILRHRSYPVSQAERGERIDVRCQVTGA